MKTIDEQYAEITAGCEKRLIAQRAHEVAIIAAQTAGTPSLQSFEAQIGQGIADAYLQAYRTVEDSLAMPKQTMHEPTEVKEHVPEQPASPPEYYSFTVENCPGVRCTIKNQRTGQCLQWIGNQAFLVMP